MFQNKMLRITKKYPLDLMHMMPKNSRHQEGRKERENILKNVVFSIIIEIRLEKKKPKLPDILKVFQGKNSPEDKELIIQKLKLLYSGSTALVDEKEDMKYQTLMT